MSIVSIQSHVAYGHAGNRSAVFPLERLGFDVWPVNTVQFSNHTGYGAWKGEVFSADHVRAVWEGMKDRQAMRGCAALLSGYMGDPSIGRAILDVRDDLKRHDPKVLYCCDPVMGDYGRGFFVRPGIFEFMRDVAVPAADIIKPNQFEAEALTGITVQRFDDAREACMRLHERGPKIILLTSFKPRDAGGDAAPAGGDAGISMLLSVEGAQYLITTPELPVTPAPNGAGDLVSALFLGQYLRSGDPVRALELMADSVFAVFERCLREGSRELLIVQSQDDFVSGRRRFTAAGHTKKS